MSPGIRDTLCQIENDRLVLLGVNASHNVLGFRVPFLHSTTDYFHHWLVLEKDSGFLFLLCLRELDRVALIAFADLYGELAGSRVEQEADIRRVAQHLKPKMR